MGDNGGIGCAVVVMVVTSMWREGLCGVAAAAAATASPPRPLFMLCYVLLHP
jgi:hypothetical protein